MFEGNGKSGDGVIVGATLVTWEHGEVDGSFEIVESLFSGLGINLSHTLSEEDHGTSGSAEGFVGRGCDDIGVFERRGDDASGDQTGDVSHIHHKVCTDQISDLSHAAVVDQAAVGRGTSNEHLWSIHQSICLQSLVVDYSSLEIDTVGEGFKVGGDGRDSGQTLIS